ncbi:MAG: outer membrane protein assembly factor BamB family protein [Mycobacteriales bacterium]
MSKVGRIITSGAVVAVAAACSTHTTSPSSAAQRPAASARTATSVTLATWRLAAPISRLTALPDGTGLILAGGLTATNASSADINRLDPTTGAISSIGHLAQAVHDAAGAMIASAPVVFGGGAATVGSAVQSPATGVVGRLPQPRADLSAVSFAGKTYLVGGYDGSRELRAVLSTTDGRTFQPVASLAKTVRYAAVVADSRGIWVFGGSHHGTPVRSIQHIDPATGQTTVAGQLPIALSDAAALDLNGHILVAGGRTTGGTVSSNVYEFDPATDSSRLVAQLAVPVADAAAAVVGSDGYLIGGERNSPAGHPVATVQIVSMLSLPASTASAPTTASGSTASLPLSDSHPFNGRLLIADRGNNRLLLVNAAKQILWTFPNSSAPAPPTGFYFPDDAFFIHHGTGIISNQEGNDTVVEIGFPSGAPLWSYGHPRVAKPAPGYLHEPDDAYLLRDGNVVVADANNCRVVFISPAGKQIGQIGQPGSCVHAPPRSLGYPNGDTPLANGNVLISEVNGSWISEYTVSGKLVWTVHLPIGYPSDPQQIGPDRYLVADYSKPGGIYEFNRKGRILWAYHPTSGPAKLNHPSLAEQLPGGFIAANDDYRDRVVIIDPRSNRIVWQYGHNDQRGTKPGYLYIPDGFDLLAPNGTTPTHPFTG